LVAEVRYLQSPDLQSPFGLSSSDQQMRTASLLAEYEKLDGGPARRWLTLGESIGRRWHTGR